MSNTSKIIKIKVTFLLFHLLITKRGKKKAVHLYIQLKL